MALSDCPKCWETPCSCGWEYRNWNTENIVEFIDAILCNRQDKEDILKRLTDLKMSNRLNKDREAKLQLKRIKRAVKALTDLGFIVSFDHVSIKFIYKDHEVTFYAYSGWASGKSIKDGRGLQNLLKQLTK